MRMVLTTDETFPMIYSLLLSVSSFENYWWGRAPLPALHHLHLLFSKSVHIVCYISNTSSSVSSWYENMRKRWSMQTGEYLFVNDCGIHYSNLRLVIRNEINRLQGRG